MTVTEKKESAQSLREIFPPDVITLAVASMLGSLLAATIKNPRGKAAKNLKKVLTALDAALASTRGKLEQAGIEL